MKPKYQNNTNFSFVINFTKFIVKFSICYNLNLNLYNPDLNIKIIFFLISLIFKPMSLHRIYLILNS
jgi:hypothetical protein